MSDHPKSMAEIEAWCDDRHSISAWSQFDLEKDLIVAIAIIRHLVAALKLSGKTRLGIPSMVCADDLFDEAERTQPLKEEPCDDSQLQS